jgi:hypothetical protein
VNEFKAGRLFAVKGYHDVKREAVLETAQATKGCAIGFCHRVDDGPYQPEASARFSSSLPSLTLRVNMAGAESDVSRVLS